MRSLTNAKATVLGASTVGGNLTVTDTVGNLTQTGVLTVAGASSFATSATSATITLTSANLLTGPASLNTNGASANASLTNSLTGDLALAASSVGGNLTVDRHRRQSDADRGADGRRHVGVHAPRPRTRPSRSTTPTC